MREYRLNIHDLMMSFILFSPIAMLLQRQLDAVNRIVVGGILICLILCILRGRNLKRKTISVISLGAAIFIYSVLNINRAYFSINMLFYYPLWILFLFYCVDSNEKMFSAFFRCKKVARTVIWTWSVLVLISFALPSSYSDGDFHSFAQGNFRFAPTVIFMAALIWAYSGFFKERKYMIFMVVPFASMIANGSRTYTVIMLLMMGLAFYNFFEKKSYFWVMLLPVVLLAVDVLAGSQFVSKFQRAMNNSYVKDPLAAFTSNRSVFWAGELRLFNSSSIIEKLIGGGLTSSYVKNVMVTGQAIWAHNDFLEALNAHGIIGLFIYIYCFIHAYKFFKKKYSFTWFQASVFLMCCFLNAFFNGLYVYTTAMLSIPFLAYAVTIDFSAIRAKEKTNNEGYNE